jgi:hypothetical protein
LGYHDAGDGGLSTYTRVPYLGNVAFTATIAGTTMTVSAVSSGTLVIDMQQLSGTNLNGIPTRIVSQTSGTPGGVGVYQIDTPQTVTSSTAFVATGIGGLKTADGSWWELVSEGEVNIIQFGAKADATFSTVWSGTDCRDGLFHAQSYLAGKFGGGVVNIPPGTYYHYACNTVPDNTWVIVAPNITYRGSGRNSSTIIFDDTIRGANKFFSLFYYNPKQPDPLFLPLEQISFEHFTIRGVLDIQPTVGRAPTAFVGVNGVKFIGMGMEYIRNSGTTLVTCDNVYIDDFYGYASYGGFVASSGCPNMHVSNFYMYGSGDDAISNGTNDQTDPPVRQGISISNGILEESQGPSFIGAKVMTISNLTMRRPVNKGLLFGRTFNDSGNTSAHSIVIKDVTVTDLLRFAEYRGRSSALYIESGLRTTAYAPGVTDNKTYVGAPGRPNASGVIADLYGDDYGYFETNHTQVGDAGAGSSGIFVSNFVVQRTLPSADQASDWGFNPLGIFSPKWNTYRGQDALYYNDAVTDEMFDNYGMSVAPSMLHTVISDGVIKGTGAYGIRLAIAAKPVTATSKFTADFSTTPPTTTMHVTAVSSGPLLVGQALSGSGVTAAHILSQDTGTPGGVGDYTIDTSQTSTNRTVNGSVAITANVDPFGFDGLEFANLQIADVDTACVSYLGPSDTPENITFRDCLFDGDPLLRSQARGVSSKAIWQMKGAFKASIAGTNMTVASVTSGSLVAGQTLFGPGISGSVQISSQSSGTPGGAGTYVVSSSQSVSSKSLVAVPDVASSFTASYETITVNTATWHVLTVTAISSGAILPGQIIYVPGTTIDYVHILGQIDGTLGGVGTYRIDVSGTQASTDFVGWIADGPVGADVSRCSRFRFIGCQFRNVVQPIVESTDRPNYKQGNRLLGRPAAFGFSPSNKGVAYCPDVGDEFGLLWEESDPANYQTFGVTLESGLSVSAAIPISGYYAPGQFVSVQTPVVSSGKVLSGWHRLTWPNSTGSNHVDGVDWAPQFIATS